MRPRVDLIVTTPLQWAGQRREPPMSLPWAMVAIPAAIDAGLAEVGGDGAVGRRDQVGQARDAVGVGLALDVDVDLHRHRHAVQGAESGAPLLGVGSLRAVGRAGGVHGLVAEVDHHGVDRGIGGRLARQAGGDDVLSAHLARRDGAGGLPRRPPPDFALSHAARPLSRAAA
jgi:hypothetical protein